MLFVLYTVSIFFIFIKVKRLPLAGINIWPKPPFWGLYPEIKQIFLTGNHRTLTEKIHRIPDTSRNWSWNCLHDGISAQTAELRFTPSTVLLSHFNSSHFNSSEFISFIPPSWFVPVSKSQTVDVPVPLSQIFWSTRVISRQTGLSETQWSDCVWVIKSHSRSWMLDLDGYWEVFSKERGGKGTRFTNRQ